MRCWPAIALLLSLSACLPELSDLLPFTERPSEPLVLRAKVEPTELALMEELTVTFDLWVEAGRALEFEPLVPPGFSGRVERLPEVALFDGQWRRVTMALRPAQVGELELPAYEAHSGELVVESPPKMITVSGLLGSAPDELADPMTVEAPAPLFPQRRPGQGWWIAGGLLALLGGGLGLWFWSRREARPAPVEPPLPPEVVARRALARLREVHPDDDASIERFYVDVSQVLRVYLEGRFGLHAPERTTEEFLPEVEQSGLLDEAQRAELQRFLTHCDLVKFAALRPGAEVHQRTLQVAEALVDGTADDRSGRQEDVA